MTLKSCIIIFHLLLAGSMQLSADNSIESLKDKTLVHYRAAEPQSGYPGGLRISQRYRVLAKPASDKSDWSISDHLTATYEAWPDYVEPKSIPQAYSDIAVHFAQVDADQRIRFRIEILGGEPIERLKVNPSRYTEMRESLKYDARWVEFEVEASDLTRHILVEINDPLTSPVLNHGLMIFLNPLSQKPEGNVLVLPSGVISETHPLMDEDSCIHIGPDSPYDALYIPDNTIINGRIDVKKPGFKIAGRGIVCGSAWKYAKASGNWGRSYPITRDHEVVKGLCNGAGETSVEGILVVHPYHFCFTGGISYTNCKAFGWRYSSDGFHGKFKRGCFAKVNDDSQYTNEGVVEYSSYWGMNNGGIFQLGWGGAAIAPGGNCHVKSCNILRSEWDADGGDRQNNGVFSGVINAQGLMQNNIFEDIRVDGQCFRFIGYKLSDGILLRNFIFKDIWFEYPLGIPEGYQKRGAPFENYLESGEISGFVFENIQIGDKKVNKLEDFGIVNRKNLGDVIFK